MSTTSNLPTWRGASGAYSKSYRLLERMAARGALRQVTRFGRTVCIPSDEMDELIEALNEGDEERIKGLNLLLSDYYPEDR